MKYLISIVAVLLALSVSSARACNTAQIAFFTTGTVVESPPQIVVQQPSAFVFQTQPAFFFQPSFGFSSFGFNSVGANFVVNSRRANIAVSAGAGSRVSVRRGLFGGQVIHVR
jgi:hypothetical protein